MPGTQHKNCFGPGECPTRQSGTVLERQLVGSKDTGSNNGLHACVSLYCSIPLAALSSNSCWWEARTREVTMDYTRVFLCIVLYLWQLCLPTHECMTGYYTDRGNCVQCGTGCKPGTCERDTGNCTCKAGWTGPRCATQCLGGYYGANCASTCSPGCVSSPCDQETGRCSQSRQGYCKPGWALGSYYRCENLDSSFFIKDRDLLSHYRPVRSSVN
ncbi:multiple epidermal growth factor-like domains protein 11 [Haliotis rubra]|uniref:multiple epidermal growth factor-like domains protein 11 n=1 Tax=Haliotis rubra TaxID=36100 RepID=UPI001EE4F0D3|nr:multiple epidermal growth factor-like domains protein 11 [Haliotis rubra]